MKGLFTLVVPTYNVERYLDEFLESLTNQTYPVGDVEILFVDDGSTDSSTEVIAKWIASVAPTAKLLQKANSGLASARNVGLERATGRWVTFSDPDDTLPPNYFGGVAEFLGDRSTDDIHLVACRLLMLDDRTGELRDHHPLRFRFEKGNRVVDLDRHPRYIHLSAASAFFRTDLIEHCHLRFDRRVQPNFEDGHFTGLYLADQERPRVAFLRDPAYHYRRRADMSSLVQDSWNRPSKFTDVPRYGYLDLLQQVSARSGAVPIWLQNLVLYDLLYYFKYDERTHSTLASVDDDVSKEFHEVLPEIMRYIDTPTIFKHHVTATSPEIRNALIIDTKGDLVRPERGRIGPTDPDQRITQLRYFYRGDLPQEEFRVGGLATEPVYGKTRSLTYLGKRMASERIVWLPATGRVRVALDGRRLRLRRQSSPPDGLDWYRALRRRAGLVRSRLRGVVAAARVVRLKRRAGAIQSQQYRNSWVFVDRNRLAQDNAEHLYRFVNEHHPEINAWFVVDRDTKDWSRLEREGFRLVQHGTPEHLLLMLNCVELISSRVDDYIVDPFDRTRFGQPRWRFTFLQHAVSTEDVSRLVNSKPIDRFIAATETEYESIAGDDTPYVFTDKEVRLTGFPRHDRLLRIAEDPAVLAADRLLLVMPTWRRDLVDEAASPGGDPTARSQLWDTPYSTTWLELLGSERLKELTDRAGLRIAVVPHPNTPTFPTASLPSHVDVFRYEDVDIQRIFARGAVIVTDCTSNAFELAYLNRPVIYFQFDRDRLCSGHHIYLPGAWSYEHHGFGPVAERTSDVLDELERLVEVGMTPQEPYATRIANGFAFRDGRSCERVFESILSMRRPAGLEVRRFDSLNGSDSIQRPIE